MEEATYKERPSLRPDRLRELLFYPVGGLFLLDLEEYIGGGGWKENKHGFGVDLELGFIHVERWFSTKEKAEIFFDKLRERVKTVTIKQDHTFVLSELNDKGVLRFLGL